MNKNALIRELEAGFEESRLNFKEGKCIPLDEFDWGIPPFMIGESKLEYRVANEA